MLDDLLVQSDHTRMDWFRDLLVDKAQAFQIIVMTCRPGDYLTPVEMASTGAHTSADAGFVRVIDLGRTIQRK